MLEEGEYIFFRHRYRLFRRVVRGGNQGFYFINSVSGDFEMFYFSACSMKMFPLTVYAIRMLYFAL